MLQWMGGSRRKMAASHTSVKKRQKQYFEHRRQQQHQLTVGSDSWTNDINNSNQHTREHQSLDILNFLNLSTATPESKPSCPEHGMEDLDADLYSLKDNISGVGSSLNNKAEPTFSKRTSFSPPKNQKNDFKRANSTIDLMDGTERKLSVFDLVGDDQTTTNLEECSPCEAHMAFSVEGLGKMNTETPDNSPQPSDRRKYTYRCSPPWKDSGQPDTSNVRERRDDFEKEVDTIIESSKMFQDDSRYSSPIGIHTKDGARKQKLHTFTDHFHKPYTRHFSDAADFNKSRVSDENKWNVGHGPPSSAMYTKHDDQSSKSYLTQTAFLDDGDVSFYWKDQQPCQMENLNHNFLNCAKDYNRYSDEYHGTKKRDYLETTWRSNIEDSPVRRPQRLERTINHQSFAKAAYFKSHEKFDFDDVFDQPVWSSTLPEEEKDSLSLRSEESCSSSAVWANETPNTSHFETNTRPRKREIDSFGSLGDKNYLNSGFCQEPWEDWDVDDRHLKRKVGSGTQVIPTSPGKLKSTSQRKGGLEETPYNWFGEVFTSAGISSDITTERDKSYPFLNPELGNSRRHPSRAPDSIPETWAPKFSVEGCTGDDDFNEHNYMNCLSENHKSKLVEDICNFASERLSQSSNEETKEVSHPKNQGDETSSSIAKSLSDENEYVRCNPHKEIMEAKYQGNRASGEKTSKDSFQQMILMERRTLQFVCLNKTLLLDSLQT